MRRCSVSTRGMLSRMAPCRLALPQSVTAAKRRLNRTQGESMARSTTEVGPFKIFMDEPPELGGKNGAPSPLDFILAAHAGCLNYMTFFIAKELGIPVSGTEITVQKNAVTTLLPKGTQKAL